MPSLFHFGLTVRDLKESVEFYRDVVGMKLIEETSDLELSGEWFDQLTENDGASFRVSHLEMDGGVQLQLVEYLTAGGEGLPLAPEVLEYIQEHSLYSNIESIEGSAG